MMSILSDHIKNIIFDFGNVIINLDFKLTLEAFQNIGAKIDGLNEIMKYRFYTEFESGKISPEEFRNKLRDFIPYNISDIELDNAWNKLLLDIPKERIELLQKIKKQYRIFLLSNSNKIHYDHYRKSLEEKYGYKKFSEIFEKVYFSFEIGCTKPSLEIYSHALKDSHLNANETIFIDDLLQNVQAAEKVGIKGYWLKNSETILDILN